MSHFEQLRSNNGRVLKRFPFVFGIFVLVLGAIAIRQHMSMIQIQSKTTTNEKVVFDDNLFGIPAEHNLGNKDNNSIYLLFNRYVNHNQFSCRNLTRVGPKGWFGKVICGDPFIKPGPHCLVYSFGSRFRFEFEEAVWKSFKCEIHTFDPSLSTDGQFIPSYIDFHLIGLSGKNFDQTEPEIWRHHNFPMLKTWKMRTLTTVMNSLNHLDKTIDILKIDIEGWEWEALPEMIESGGLRNVKQLCLELHFGHSFKINRVNGKNRIKYTQNTWGNVPLKGQILALKQLFDYGFRIVKYIPVGYTIIINKTRVEPLSELTLINVNFLS